MIIIDIIAVLVVFALLLVGGPVLVYRWRMADPKRRALQAASEVDVVGETNTVKFNLNQLRKCLVCRKMTDPKRDMKATGGWIHEECYLGPDPGQPVPGANPNPNPKTTKE